MSDYDDKLASMPPLGKSVAEVEADGQNQVNPPPPAENLTSAALPPVPVANTGVGTAGNVNATGTPDAEFEALPLLEGGAPRDEGR